MSDFDPLDPESLPRIDNQETLAKHWTKEWATVDVLPTKKRTIRFPVFPKKELKHECPLLGHMNCRESIAHVEMSIEHVEMTNGQNHMRLAGEE